MSGRVVPVTEVPVVTIDGPSGSGKGTVARAVALNLGWTLLDSGALYRLVAYAARLAGIGLGDGPGLARLAQTMQIRFGANDRRQEQIWLDGCEVSQHIRTETAGNDASA